MRLVPAIVLLTMAVACSGAGLFQEYEYEEELYLSTDGSATIYVNGSIPALNALRGTTFDTRPNARFDRVAVRDFFTTASSRVTRLSSSRRHNRRYVHARIAVGDVSELDDAAPFAWSEYRFAPEGNVLAYRQRVGAPARGDAGAVEWTGDERVAFRVHVPSRITFHNAGEGNPRRGNIVVWEQSLGARLEGDPLELDVRMEPQSILYRTLWLFGLTALAVAIGFGLLIVWLTRRRPGT